MTGIPLRESEQVEFTNILVCINFNGSWHNNEDKTRRIDYETVEYPGTRVANAYFNGNKNGLPAEEKDFYEIAVGIVDEAKKYSSVGDKARYIQNAIHERIHTATAIEALIRGKTD